jgi:hypothetical protein
MYSFTLIFQALNASSEKELRAALEGFLKKGEKLFLELKV